MCPEPSRGTPVRKGDLNLQCGLATRVSVSMMSLRGQTLDPNAVTY